MDSYYKGDSIKLTIQLKTSTGDVIPVSNVDDVDVKVYNSSGLTILKQGKLSTGEVITKDDAAGEVAFTLEDGLTDSASSGKYSVMTTITETDTDFDDDTDTSISITSAFQLLAKPAFVT